MKIGLLIIGSEILEGRISDLNSKTLIDFLASQQLELQETLTIRDEKESIIKALVKLFESNDVVITSGGLGPTKDDITKETLGDYFSRKLIFSQDSLEITRRNYLRFNKSPPEKEHGYHFIPESFIALPNRKGFAPGLFTKQKNKFLLSAPGVPVEFKTIIYDHLTEKIPQLKKNNLFRQSLTIRTKNVPEEKIFNEVDPSLWKRLSSLGVVSSLPVLMGVDIGIKVSGKTHGEVQEKISQIEEIINSSPIKKNIWHIGNESLEEVIVNTANKKKITFGFAESATGGLCSHRITNVAGSSKNFIGSVICYNERIKENFLEVQKETLQNKSAVSLECAEEMAEGLRKNFDLDIAISITGFAGPGGGNEAFPVGSVCIGSSTKAEKVHSFHSNFHGDRETLKKRFSQIALYRLLDELRHFPQT